MGAYVFDYSIAPDSIALDDLYEQFRNEVLPWGRKIISVIKVPKGLFI
jgi:hypothetical protein